MTFEVRVEFDFDHVDSDGKPAWAHKHPEFAGRTTEEDTIFLNAKNVRESILNALKLEYGEDPSIRWSVVMTDLHKVPSLTPEINPEDFTDMIAAAQQYAEKDITNLLLGNSSYDNITQILEDFAFRVREQLERRNNG
jgi:hypothetical protein